MTQLDSRGDLAAAEIAYYSPALLLFIVLVLKHGIDHIGWLYGGLVCVLRIIGASCLLYIETQNDYSQKLFTTAAITSAIGVAPLLVGLMSFIQRVNSNNKGNGIPRLVFDPVHMVAVIGLVLAIIGGVFESGSNVSRYPTGKKLMEAGSILFVAVYVALVLLTILTATRMSSVPRTETKLVIAACVALPFLLVRVVYSVCIGFGSAGSIFYFKEPDVWIEAFMMFLMEGIVLILYIWAGFVTPKQSQVDAQVGRTPDVEQGKRPGLGGMGGMRQRRGLIGGILSRHGF